MRIQLPDNFEGLMVGDKKANLGIPDRDNCVEAPDNIADLLIRAGGIPMEVTSPLSSLLHDTVRSDETGQARADRARAIRAEETPAMRADKARAEEIAENLQRSKEPARGTSKSKAHR
jgi:hypothetical protein